MAVNLNLLPENFAVKKGLAKVLAMARQATLGLIIVFILIVIGISSFFFISTFELNSLNSRIDDLKSQISQQETVETQVVLLKDRIAKIKRVQSIESSDKTFAAITPVIDNVPQGANLGELSVDSKKVDTSVLFTNTQSLGQFFNSLSSIEGFTSVILTSFGFNPVTGYLASLRLIK